MEGYDSLMMRTMFEIVPPNRELSMKEEYHEKFANGLKAEIPELFPTVRIIPEPRFGVVFKGPKTKIIFLGVREADILIFDLDDDGWNVMPRRRHAEIEKKVMNILRKLYREKGQGARNARLFRAITGIPGGPVGEISGYLTGYKGKNAEQQGDIAAEEAGIQSAFPNRKKFSGRRKTLRRKNLRSSRKNK
jgi:hypothetical protein